MSEAIETRDSLSRARQIGWAGTAIIVIGAGAAALPLIEWASGSLLIGSLLVVAGLIEMLAGALRRAIPYLAMSAGGVTVLAGLLFLLEPVVHFTPVIYIIVAWLILRSAILFVASPWSRPPVRFWMFVSAATDLILALLLLAGLSIATIVVLFFGPTREFVASFAWVLALSFAGTGLLLLNVASCERRTST